MDLPTSILIYVYINNYSSCVINYFTLLKINHVKTRKDENALFLANERGSIGIFI